MKIQHQAEGTYRFGCLFVCSVFVNVDDTSFERLPNGLFQWYNLVQRLDVHKDTHSQPVMHKDVANARCLESAFHSPLGSKGFPLCHLSTKI